MFHELALDERYPQATKVRLVMDNWNTHSTASLYEAFAPEEARRLARRLEIHYIPKHVKPNGNMRANTFECGLEKPRHAGLETDTAGLEACATWICEGLATAKYPG